MSISAMRERLNEYDKVKVTIGLALAVSALIVVYGAFRLGAWLSYKTIEGHIEKKIERMVRPEALR